MNLTEKDLALKLFDAGAVMDKRRSLEGRGFQLKLHEKEPLAPLSPYYLNLRVHPKGPLADMIVQDIGMALYSYAERMELSYDRVVGIPQAGEPMADAFGQCMPLYRPIRLGKIENNGKRRISGIESGSFESGQCVLLIDDLITKADTKLEAILELEVKNLVVEDVLVLVDREQGGANEMRGAGYNFHSVFTISQLLEIYLQEERIPEEIHDEIIRYLFH